MKPLLLGLSLAANAVLLAGIAYLALPPHAPGQIDSPKAGTNLDQPRPASPGPVTPTASPSTTGIAARAGPWQSPADAQKWLVSINAPLNVRYAIAQAMLDQKYKPATDAARYPPDMKRWQRRHPQPDQTDRQNAVRQQQEEELTQLFGPDLARARYGDDTVAKSGLTPESWLEINRVGRDYGEATSKLMRAGSLTPNERRLLNDEKNADLAKVLPPAEYDTYQAYYSPDGDRLQRAMKGLDVDDDTYLRAFRAIAPVKTTEAPSRSVVQLTPDEIRAIEQAVGPEVAAHITRNQTPRRLVRPLPSVPPPAPRAP